MSKRTVRRWFTAVLLAAVIALALMGSKSEELKEVPPKFLLYWLLVGVLLLWVVMLVFVDMITIRRDFISSRRSILRNTIGDPELLKKLRDARNKADNHCDEE
jgi:hypothetical protein